MLNKLGCKTTSDTKIDRSKKPHIAIITLKIDVRAIESDGTFDDQVLGNEALSKYGISRAAQIQTTGVTEADCINKTKQMLEKLNG